MLWRGITVVSRKRRDFDQWLFQRREPSVELPDLLKWPARDISNGYKKEVEKGVVNVIY